MHTARRIGAAALAASFFATTAAAQTVLQIFPHTGEVVTPDLQALANKSRKVTKVVKGANVTFNVTYEDVEEDTGDGFDDVFLGDERQATVEAALLYIDSVLLEGGSCDIVFELSEFDATGFLAAMGPFFFVSPGYDSGFAYDHITTGVDPCTACFGGQDGPDMSGTVDFGYTWNSELDAPGPGEFDLFTVLLHELTHGLGFLSLIEPDGTSSIGGNRQSKLDQFMGISTGAMFFNAAAATPVYSRPTSDLVSGDVFYYGAAAADAYGAEPLKPAMYAPNPFEEGSSLSHLDPDVHPGAVMNPAIAPQVTKRTFSDVELGFLVDMGYENVVAPTSDPFILPPGSPAAGLAGLAALAAAAAAGGWTLARRKK